MNLAYEALAVAYFGHGPVRNWSLAGHPLTGPAEQLDWVPSIAHCGHGNYLATGHHFGGVKLWNAHSGEPLATLQADTGLRRDHDYMRGGADHCRYCGETRHMRSAYVVAWGHRHLP